MDAGDLQQLELLAKRALKQGREKYHSDQDQLFAAHAARGILGSGATIKEAVRLMGEASTETLEKLLDQCGEVSRSSEAFGLIASTLEKLLDSFHEQLPTAIGMGTRGNPSPSITQASEALFAKLRSDIKADISVARYGYLKSGGSVGAPSANGPPPKKNAGGKPLAEHWDALWAAIAVQLWTGDLKPKKQADVKKAMFEWLNANEIEVGDTAVTQRARQLWQAMQAADS